jgi:phosphatidylglycerol:prolipoprotein diacylglycerol transferase
LSPGGGILRGIEKNGVTCRKSLRLFVGKTITTGLIGAYIGVEVVKLILGIRVKTGDDFAVPIALALAVGRWGCFFNGCCYGVATDLPWGVDFGDGVRRHPTQIYESLFHTLMAGVFIFIVQRGWLRQQRLKFYLIAYFAFRFATEFIRPEPVAALGLTFYQWVALAAIGGLAGQWWWDERHEQVEPPGCCPDFAKDFVDQST